MEKSHSTHAADASFPGPIIFLHEAWEIYKEKLATLLGISLLPAAFSVLYYAVLLNPNFSNPDSLSLSLLLLVLVIDSIIISLWSQAALITTLIHKDMKVTHAYKLSMTKILPLFWVTVILALYFFGGIMLFIFPAMILSVLLRVNFLYFYYVFIIPIVFLIIKYCFIDFIVVNEDVKGPNALAKSSGYVKARWWKVFWSLLPLWIVSLLPAVLFKSMLLNSESSIIGSELFSLFFGPFYTVYIYRVYVYLKATHKGSTVE